jgi:hypothetical protein
MNSETPKTKFRLDIEVSDGVNTFVVKKYFTTLKVMRQWQKRNDLDNNFFCFDYKELTKNKAGEWEYFTVIGKKILLISQLKNIIHKLEK